MSKTSNHAVEIRIQNASAVDFDRVRVIFPDRNEENYGALARGKFSAFRGTRRAYRYAEVHVIANGQDVSLHPMDYTGEQELPPGRYTYVLRLEAGRLSIDVQKAD